MIDIHLSKEVISPVIIIIVLFLIYLFLSRIIKKLTSLRINNDKRKKTIIGLLNNIIKYFFIAIGILMILNVYGINTSAIIASLGVVSLVFGLALQDLLKDFLSGIFIIFENQYGIGDTVTINDFKGEVVFLGLRTTRLKAYTGEIKILSNRNINEVINHTLDNSLARVNIQVSYESDLRYVDEVLNKLCDRFNKELKYLKSNVILLGVTSLEESGINFRIEVETEPLKNYEIERIMYKEIKMEFDKKGITIPYKQVVIRNV